MNNWDRIEQHYAEFLPAILAGRKDEWAIDAYAWDGIGITLTPIENWLWQDIRQANAVFYPQFPIAGFFADFANPKARVVIECDGRDYHLDKTKDAARDQRLGELGWTVYRITGSQCRTEQDEETGASGYARRFIDWIADTHGLRRENRGRGWITFKQEATA